ncbi:MAG: hypothetical protein KDB40_07785 [Acidimicrobiales bacterium]|nr:hypothetical protein [Acidimicrobiales bacterium]MCB9393109.1 hypothetical protein [Acidimicrobiaceae bacterium]
MVGARDGGIERWFVRRGVPHFIDDYAPTTDIWNRSLPMLVIAYVAGGLHALDLADWSWQRNLLAALVVVVVVVGGWVVTNVVRGRRPFQVPDVVGTPELALFLVGPTIPSVIFGQWGDAFQTLLEGAVVLLIIYVATSYAVVALLGWAARRSAAQLPALASLVVRALPLLLLFTTFLFINAEVWQVAGTLTGLPYVATLAIFFVLGAFFVLSRVPGIMRGLATFSSWDAVRDAAEGTPIDTRSLPASGAPPAYALSRRQRVNAALVAVFSQALQVTFVALLLTLFFSVFGFLAIPEATTGAWTGLDQVHVLLRIDVDGRPLVISEPLLRVAGFLGAFTGLYFTVVLSTDATYRDEFAEDVGPQIRQALAVRVAYLHHRARSSAPGPLDIAPTTAEH